MYIWRLISQIKTKVSTVLGDKMKYKKIVIKVGSNVLTATDGSLDTLIIQKIVKQLAIIKERDIYIVLISSGAVASGRGLIKLSKKADSVSSRQVLASVGQVKLLHTYYDFFNKENIICSQVLVTKEDFRDKTHYFNMRNCFDALLEQNVLPIVNENDVVSVSELMFTDNDELAGLIATMLNADALLILSNVDGIFNGNPKDENAKIIQIIDEKSIDFSTFVSTEKSNFGRGGMYTKCNIAKKVAKSGIAVHIANGKKDNILIDLLDSTVGSIGTTFLPIKQASNTKKRIAFAASKGKIVLNQGAVEALKSPKATSLLAVGIVDIVGEFYNGDIVDIVDDKKNIFGLGKVQYSSKKLIEIKGMKHQKPVIHYDFLYLFE